MEKSEYFDSIQERTNLAGTNKMELLVFDIINERSGFRQKSGLNVFKIKEVMETPVITGLPGSKGSLVGMINLRGEICTVIDLPHFLGFSDLNPKRHLLIVTEYNNQIQGFLVDSVDKIMRFDWSDIKAPPEMLANNHLTAIAEDHGNLISILDIENILEDNSEHTESKFNEIKPLGQKRFIFCVDDSKTARNLITKTLEKLEIEHRFAFNGEEALKQLKIMADTHKDDLSKHLDLILTDIEMPAMDGFTLTKTIRSDPRFKDIPIIAQSSLSGSANKKKGEQVGMDGYVDKFNAVNLADTIKKFLK